MKNKIIYQDNLITKFLIESPKYGNYEIVVDTEDLNRIKFFTWHLCYDKKRNHKCIITHIYKNNKRTTISLHHFIISISGIDHKDSNTLNNCKYNLRKCSSSENQYNSIKCTNKSGFKGVSWDKYANKWKVNIAVNKNRKYLGLFINKIDAAKAYNEAAIKYHGEFAKLNETQ